MGVLSVANTSVIWWGQGLGREAEEEAAVEASMIVVPEEMLGASSSSPRRHSISTLREYPKDHRLLATCESGPPMEVRVPELETVGWDLLDESYTGESLATRRGKWAWWQRWTLPRIQEVSLLEHDRSFDSSAAQDWMTAHPRIDPIDGSLIFYSSNMFEAPHVRYSVIDRNGRHLVWKEPINIGRAKM